MFNSASLSTPDDIHVTFRGFSQSQASASTVAGKPTAIVVYVNKKIVPDTQVEREMLRTLVFGVEQPNFYIVVLHQNKSHCYAQRLFTRSKSSSPKDG